MAKLHWLHHFISECSLLKRTQMSLRLEIQIWHTQSLTTDRVTVLKQREEFKYWEFWVFSPTAHMIATDEEPRALMIKPPWLANKRAHGVLSRCTTQEAEYLPNMKYLSFPTRKKRPWFMCAEFVLVRSRCRQRLRNLCTSKMLFAVKLE